MKALGLFALGVCLFGASGCYSFALLQSELPSSAQEADSDITIRVTTIDGERVILKDPWVDRRVVDGDPVGLAHKEDSISGVFKGTTA